MKTEAPLYYWYNVLSMKPVSLLCQKCGFQKVFQPALRVKKNLCRIWVECKSMKHANQVSQIKIIISNCLKCIYSFTYFSIITDSKNGRIKSDIAIHSMNVLKYNSSTNPHTLPSMCLIRNKTLKKERKEKRKETECTSIHSNRK